LESTVRYLGIEVDDALEISEQIEIWSCPGGCPKKAFDATGGCFPAGCWKGRIGQLLSVIRSTKPSSGRPLCCKTRHMA